MLGLLLGTVGLDLVNATPRFVFGSDNLAEGIPFLPLLIGLFALPDIIEHYMSKARDLKPHVIDKTRYTRADFRKPLPTILKGSAIGITMGAIPGHRCDRLDLPFPMPRRSAAHPDRAEFGKGALSGVAAAGKRQFRHQGGDPDTLAGFGRAWRCDHRHSAGRILFPRADTGAGCCFSKTCPLSMLSISRCSYRVFAF